MSNKIKEELKNLGLNLSETGLKKCKDIYAEEHNVQESKITGYNIFSIALQMDLKKIGSGFLPENISSTSKISGKHILQLEDIRDITKANIYSSNLSFDSKAISNSPQRMLRFQLSDGKRNVVGIEIKKLGGPFNKVDKLVPGIKLSIIDIPVKNGMLVFDSLDHVKIEGGSAYEVENEWRARQGIHISREEKQGAPKFKPLTPNQMKQPKHSKRTEFKEKHQNKEKQHQNDQQMKKQNKPDSKPQKTKGNKKNKINPKNEPKYQRKPDNQQHQHQQQKEKQQNQKQQKNHSRKDENVKQHPKHKNPNYSNSIKYNQKSPIQNQRQVNVHKDFGKQQQHHDKPKRFEQSHRNAMSSSSRNRNAKVEYVPKNNNQKSGGNKNLNQRTNQHLNNSTRNNSERGRNNPRGKRSNSRNFKSNGKRNYNENNYRNFGNVERDSREEYYPTQMYDPTAVNTMSYPGFAYYPQQVPHYNQYLQYYYAGVDPYTGEPQQGYYAGFHGGEFTDHFYGDQQN